MDECAILHQKFKLLERERLRLQSQKIPLNSQIDEEEEKNLVEALKCAAELDILAMAPGYGTTKEEVSTLVKLVKLHDKKVLELTKELEKVNIQIEFESDWNIWSLRMAAKGLTCANREKIGPEPKRSDYSSSS